MLSRIDMVAGVSAQEGVLRALGEEGCAILDGVFSPALIDACGRAFLRRHRVNLQRERPRGIQRVGDRRWMVTVKVQPPFSSPELYANPMLLPAMQTLLGSEVVLNSLGVVASLPGAEAQHDHRDLPPLFDDTPIDTQLPCYAITVLVPLIDANAHHGSTMLRPGSHRVGAEEATQRPGVTPEVPVGSCVLMDYRLQHGGTANRSDQLRPLLYLVYARPWFRDYRNFRKQPPLLLPRRVARQLPPEHRHLFSTAKQTWW